MDTRTRNLLHSIGVEAQSVSHVERLVSGLGGLLGIGAIYLVSSTFLPPSGAAVLIASMGASAVLLFAVPHGALSQPWPLLGGHLVSALVGVACARVLPASALAASAAVGSAVLVMHYLRCIHPPGGATALVAVIGGPEVRDLGFDFAVAPVLLDASILLVCAVLFNSLFSWRRYPASGWRKRRLGSAPEPDEASRAATLPHVISDNAATASGYPPIAHEDFVYALSQIDSFIDVSEEDLVRIYDLATRRVGRRTS